MATYVNNGDVLERQKWMTQGFVKEAKKSYFAGYMGDMSNLIHRVISSKATEGHIINFQARGHITGKTIRGLQQTQGTGEQKRLFSSRIEMELWSKAIDNGNKYQAITVGTPALHDQMDSRNLLAEYLVGWNDQYTMDTLQGNVVRPTSRASIPPSHIVTLPLDDDDNHSDIGWNAFDPIRTLAIAPEGGIGTNAYSYAVGGNRMPLRPIRMSGGEPCYILLVNSDVANMIRRDDLWQQNFRGGDVRGSNNRLLRFQVGTKIGSLIVLEAPYPFGGDDIGVHNTNRFDYDLANGKTGCADFSPEQYDISNFGFRRGFIKTADTASELDSLVATGNDGVKWEGQPDWDEGAGRYFCRCLLLGANAVQQAWGMLPIYSYESFDHNKQSESAVMWWMNQQKTRYDPKLGGDYGGFRVTGIDAGVICIDVQIGRKDA